MKPDKSSYPQYLESATWKKLRAAALKRDDHTCRACGDKAKVVHHVRYPKTLGEEPLEWLYSLCAPCHDAIHKAAKLTSLRRATNLILEVGRPEGKVIRLPDDWRLDGKVTKARHKKKSRKGKARRAKKPKLRTGQVIHIRGSGKPLPAHISANQKKTRKIIRDNDELHEFFKQNRERRERRRAHG